MSGVCARVRGVREGTLGRYVEVLIGFGRIYMYSFTLFVHFKRYVSTTTIHTYMYVYASSARPHHKSHRRIGADLGWPHVFSSNNV